MAIDRSVHLAKWCPVICFAPIQNFKFSQGRSTSREFIVLLIIIGLETLSSGVCEQQRRRPACASAQSDQRLCYSLIGKYHI